MRRIGVIAVALLGVLLLSGIASGELALTSPQLQPGGRLGTAQVFFGFGCTGGNTSPALHWEGAPKGTKSFAVTLYDPDAPSGWWHWLIFNIPANVSHLPENAGNLTSGLAPEGSIQGMTDFGKPGYGGACPPVGDKPHRYQFTLFALDIEKLPLDSHATGGKAGFYLNQHVLAKTTLTVYYSR